MAFRGWKTRENRTRNMEGIQKEGGASRGKAEPRGGSSSAAAPTPCRPDKRPQTDATDRSLEGLAARKGRTNTEKAMEGGENPSQTGEIRAWVCVGTKTPGGRSGVQAPA